MDLSPDIQKAIGELKYDYENREKEYVSKCNLCGGDYFTTICHMDRYGYVAEASLCNSCGLVFLNPRLTKSEYRYFYESVYRPLVSAFHGREINHLTIQKEQHTYAEELGDFLKQWIDQDGNLLDIGGSTGVVAAYFAQRFGLSPLCVDPSPQELREAEDKGVRTVCCMIEDYELSDSPKFDLVLICQTVDHLLDVRSTLEKVRRLIKDDGLLFADIVDFRAAYLRNRSIEAAIKIDHPYYFTRETMAGFLSVSGFKIIAEDFFRDQLHIGFVCSPTKEEPIGNQMGRKVADRLIDEIRFIQNYHL
jgi:SAM-dependent methyltransferase